MAAFIFNESFLKELAEWAFKDLEEVRTFINSYTLIGETKKTDDEKIKLADYTCEHIMTRGKKPAGSLCGKKAKFEHEGKWYCGTQKENIYTGHIRTAHLASKKKTEPIKKETKEKDPDLRAKEILAKIMNDTRKTKVRTHPIHKVVYHPPSMIVVDPNTHRALGSLDEDLGVVGLSEQQKHICDLNNWPYDNSENEEANEEENVDEDWEDEIEQDFLIEE